EWGVEGDVVSDCDGVRDVAANHRYRPTQAQGAAISVIRGMDNECVTFTSRFGEPVEKAYIDAVQQGYLPESVLDTALIRLFTARIKLGMFDPPDMVPYTKIEEKELDSAEHRAHARRLANESMVLLKNDGLLPLKPEIKKIAVVGPLADQTRPLIGNYAGQPTHIVSILDGLHAEFPNTTITFVPGTQFLRTDGSPVPDSVLTTPDGKPGLKAEYNEGMPRGQLAPGANTKPIVSRTEANVKLTDSNLPAEIAGKKTFGVQWSGFLGGDRTSIDLPQPEEELVEGIAATGKPLAVVLMNGSALAVNWINEHANAVLEAWYPGEEGGAAVAETLSGKNNPAGRLPLTFYTGVDQLPNFEDYGMANRTYRYFAGKPLY